MILTFYKRYICREAAPGVTECSFHVVRVEAFGRLEVVGGNDPLRLFKVAFDQIVDDDLVVVEEVLKVDHSSSSESKDGHSYALCHS